MRYFCYLEQQTAKWDIGCLLFCTHLQQKHTGGAILAEQQLRVSGPAGQCLMLLYLSLSSTSKQQTEQPRPAATAAAACGKCRWARRTMLTR